jgi:hypothetical protein
MLNFLIKLLKRRAPAMDPQLEDELLLLRHLHLDA